ncbi:MAG: endonuclease/exonuclease/phosphatase family protein [Crocinitomicaceae bacterium]
MKSFQIYLFIFVGTFSFSIVSNAQDDKKVMVTCVGFYNLENIFDYQDDSLIRDEEFLPEGEKVWDSTKYANKLHNMSRVINEIGTKYTPHGAAVLGVCEVENKGVLEDLVAMPVLKERDYQIVHFDSPDKRGIDVGLLYQERYFKLKKAVKYPLIFEDNPNYKTRDQLVVTGDMLGEDITFIVCHWPSRWGGQTASEPSRIAAAKLSRQIIDSLMTDDPNAKIILMGDLNDDPVNVSMTEYIRAKGKKKKLEEGDLFNTFWKHYKKGNGTLAYQDAWNLFDQIVISQPFLEDDLSSFVFHEAVVFKRDWMLQKEGRFAGYPLRTHAGGKYTNGYSDHFPTYIILKKYIN